MPEHPLIIKKECVHSLFECLNTLSKKQLLIIADQIMPVSFNTQQHTKAVLVPALQAEIQKQVLYAFKYFYPFVSAFFVGFVFKDRLSDILKNFKELEQVRIPRDELEIIAAQILMESGMCFAFLPKGKRTVRYVIPDELHTVAAQMAGTLSSEETQPIARNDFLLYGNVLTSLYGICPVDLFMDIYNRDTIHPITDKQAFLWCMEEAASVSGTYFFIDDSIVSNYFFHPNYDNQKDVLSACREEFEPYIPTEEEILKKFFLPSYDADLEAYKQCVDWLTQYMADKDAVANLIENICVFIKGDCPLKDQFDLLNPYKDELAAASLDEFKRFAGMLSDLNNSSHRWTLWGHTADELFEEERAGASATGDDADASDNKEQKSRTIQHIDLPEDCRIPSAEEYETQSALFDDYCNHGHNPPWHRDGETHTSRIAPSYKKIAHVFNQMPDDQPEQLFDQWLASIWHKKANRSGTFGNQQWNYAVFTPLEKLGHNVYSCEGHDGKIFVAYSPTIERFFGDYRTFMSVSVDMGGWYILYGPVIFWKGLFTFDFTALAKKVAPQMYKDQGLNAVIQFNPCPFWATSYLAHVPSVAHGEVLAIESSLECTFKNNTIPEFPKSWTREAAGNYTRWLYNKNDYLNSRRIYYNHKTHEVFLSAHNNDAFNKLLKNVSKYIDISKHGIEKMSMILTMFCYNTLKYPHKLAELEKKFEKSQRV